MRLNLFFQFILRLVEVQFHQLITRYSKFGFFK
jgi:hypothetical protein